MVQKETDYLLECRSLVLGYDKKIVAGDVNFHVCDGDYLCIVGENGSGKSTLMRTLLGLQPALGGEIIRGGGLRHGEVGYLPQQTEAQRDFPASVYEIVLSGCLNRCGMRPFYGKAEKERAAVNMRRMGIEELKNRCFAELSGGQKQRVLLARALCAASKLLLLDEPVAGLDPKVTEDMYSLIYDLNRSDGMTVIMISHDIDAAVKYATHILHIGSTPLFFGTADDYVKSGIGYGGAK